MKAVLFYGPQDIRYEETRIKPLEKGEILVKIQAALTCGTDVKTFRRGHPVLIKNIPSGFGHEFSGIVEKVADDVKNVKAGDRVVCANSAPCGECFYCKRGEYNLCENLNLLNGAYAEYIVVPERIVKKNTLILPPSLPFEKAAFSEPLANVVHGVERTGIKAGDSVGIIGIGPIGLMFARLCKLKGARVIVAGRNPIKLKLAEEFAHADEIVDLKKYSNPEIIFKDFSDEKTQIILKCKGYDCTNLSQCICRLIQKLQSDPDFPHEIGLFLGYPAEDVKGFIENKAACSKCSGCWKVYGDEQAARILFKKYKKCTEIYCRRWKSGVAVEQLTITI